MAAINPLGGRQPLGFNNNDQTARTSVQVEVATPRPTAEQLAAEQPTISAAAVTAE